MKSRVLNDRGLAWVRRLKEKELGFARSGESPHLCRVARAFIRRDDGFIPHLFLECEHGGRATRAIEFKYRGAGWRQ